LTTPHQYESFLAQQARKRNIKPDSSLQEKLAVCRAAVYAITIQLFIQNLTNISPGFLRTIESDIRQVNFFLLRLSESPGGPDLSSARERLDAAYGQIVVALSYYQTPNEEPDTYKRLSNRTLALQNARKDLAKCLLYWFR
jgi:hypothetical protein